LGILGKVKEYLVRNLSLTDEKAWDRTLWNMWGSQALSGETVSEYTALTYSAVYNAITLIAGTIGALPLHLMQRKGEKKRVADDRRMYRVMHDEWNPWMTAMAGRETMMAHVLAWGNGYAEIVRNGMGELIQLWPISPNRIRPELRGGNLVYRIRVDNQDVYLPREKVLHIPGLGFDGYAGYPVISMARKSIGLGMALETFGSLYFGQGTHPGVVVSHPGKLSQIAHNNLSESLVKAHSGLGQSHKLLLLEEGMKLEKLLIHPDDSQFLESRQFQIPEIARWFNVPPHKLKDLTKSSFSNIESEQQSFYGDTILPWLVRFEQCYNQQLLSTSDKEYSGRGRLYFKHNAEGILRADTAARAAYYSSMFNIGALSINEIRAYEDKDPVEGGDIHLVPMNMTTLENAGKLPEPKALPAPKPGNGEDKEAADEA
jgi:HK97 family phage portal protein